MYDLQLTVFAITVVVGRNSRGEAASDQHIGRARFHVTQTVNVNSCIVICTVCEEEYTFYLVLHGQKQYLSGHICIFTHTRKVYELCAKSMTQGDGDEKSTSFLEVLYE